MSLHELSWVLSKLCGRCKGLCMIEGCTRYEEGNNAVCKM